MNLFDNTLRTRNPLLPFQRISLILRKLIYRPVETNTCFHFSADGTRRFCVTKYLPSPTTRMTTYAHAIRTFPRLIQHGGLHIAGRNDV